MPKMRRMTIKSSEWFRRGPEQHHTSMSSLIVDSKYSEGGKKYCCMGIHGRLLGVSDGLMRGCAFPSSVGYATNPSDPARQYAEAYSEIRQAIDSFEQRVARINDDGITDDEHKIAKLRPLFKLLGITIVWRPEL